MSSNEDAVENKPITMSPRSSMRVGGEDNISTQLLHAPTMSATVDAEVVTTSAHLQPQQVRLFIEQVDAPHTGAPYWRLELFLSVQKSC
eukprot:COSAG05_NODE_2197_length_3410_cov_7.529447_4_plen_89_part_00